MIMVRKHTRFVDFPLHKHDYIEVNYVYTGELNDFLINSLYNNSQNGQFLYYKVAEVPAIQDMIGKMIEEIMHPTAFSESTIKLYMGLFLIELIKNSDKVERKEEASINHYLVVESLKYIENQFKDASLYELADQLKQSHYGLSKTIKKATSHTFKELLQERRLVKAKELLEGTDMAIASIVEQVGYDNISYFYRIFKWKYGLTPKEYRKRILGG